MRTTTRVILLVCFFFFVSSCTKEKESALNATGDSSTAWAQQNSDGISHFNEGHWKSATKYFKEAVATNPEFARGHYNLALALHNAGNHGEATIHFKKAAELAPDDIAIQQSKVLKEHIGG